MLPSLNYIHDQVEAAAVWTINHGLNCQPIVHVYINIEGSLQRCLPLSIVAVTNRQVVVTFTNPQTGQAILQ